MKKIRKSVLLMVLLLLCLAIGGCKKKVGTPEDNPIQEEKEEVDDVDIVIGFSAIDMGNPFYTTLEHSIREEAKRKGYPMITKDSQGSQELQNQHIHEMIEEGINILILTPVDREGITPSLKELKDAKVKVINVDSKVKETKYIEAFIGSDNEKAGQVCAEEMIARIPEGGKVVILENQAQSAVIDRITSFEESLSGAEKGFEIVERRDTKGQKDLAASAILEILGNNKDVDAIMCGNDQIAFAVQHAVKSLNQDTVMIFSVDGSPEIKQELEKPDSNMVATVAQTPISIGKTAFDTLEAIADGKEFEEEILEPVYLVTKENLEAYGIDGWK